MSERELTTSQSTDTGPGQRLHDARVQERLSREQVAEMLHLSPQQISALESDDFKSLPGATYARGYLRSYAQLLGLPVDEVVASYARLNGAYRSARLNALVPEPQITTRDGSVKFATFLVVTVLIVLAVIWWQGRDYRLRPNESVDRGSVTDISGDTMSPARIRGTARGVGTEVEPSTVPPVPEPATHAGEDVVPGSTPALEPGAASAASTTTSVEARIEQPGVAGIAPPSTGGDAGDLIADVAPAGFGVAGASDAHLVLETSESCWVDVRDARDNRLIYKLLPPGRTVTVFGDPPLKVFLGNPEGIMIKYNGEDIDPVQFKRGRVARFTLGATTASDN
ncbi:MAG: RodZ domain-containing protein [Acidiferrobacterales bacterium]